MLRDADKLEQQEVRLLDHQMNAVRDTAAHWLVLQKLFKEASFSMDPFAAEYLSEVLSMVLTYKLRRSQTLTRQLNKSHLDLEVIERINTQTFVMVPPPASTQER